MTFISLCPDGILLPYSKRVCKPKFSAQNIKLLPHVQFDSLKAHLQAIQHPKSLEQFLPVLMEF